MSGLVIRTRGGQLLILRRSDSEVSPSYTAAVRPELPASVRNASLWSRSSAFKGNSKRAHASGSLMRRSRTGIWYARVFPLAVLVDRTVSFP
jgi:hypothetical protein